MTESNSPLASQEPDISNIENSDMATSINPQDGEWTERRTARKRKLADYLLPKPQPDPSKLFKCPQCDRSFNKRAALAVHSKIHVQSTDQLTPVDSPVNVVDSEPPTPNIESDSRLLSDSTSEQQPLSTEQISMDVVAELLSDNPSTFGHNHNLESFPLESDGTLAPPVLDSPENPNEESNQIDLGDENLVDNDYLEVERIQEQDTGEEPTTHKGGLRQKIKCNICQLMVGNKEIHNHMRQHFGEERKQCKKSINMLEPTDPGNFGKVKLGNTSSIGVKPKSHSQPTRQPARMINTDHLSRPQKHVRRRRVPVVQTYLCELCNLVFSDKKIYIQHVTQHPEIEPLVCDDCGEEFYEEQGYLDHTRKRVCKDRVECDLCGLFVLSSDIKEHRKMHLEDDVESVDDSSRFSEAIDESHSVSVVDDNDSIAPSEVDGFYLKEEVHEPRGGRPKKKKSPLDKLNILCSVPKPPTGDQAKCYICSMWVERSNLVDHRKTHFSQYNCALCGERFISNSALRKHSKAVHKATSSKKQRQRDVTDILKRYECQFCNMSFLSAGRLSKHIIDFHGEHRCEFCEDLFESKWYLNKHIFICKSNPYRNQDKHPTKAHRCPVCKLVYYGHLTEHLRVHTGEMPYQCTVCLDKFRSASNLKTHFSRLHGPKRFICEYCDKRMSHRGDMAVHVRQHIMRNDPKPRTHRPRGRGRYVENRWGERFFMLDSDAEEIPDEEHEQRVTRAPRRVEKKNNYVFTEQTYQSN